ncbi:MAG: chorismate mutase [Candidatus Dormibacteria bacterium]
MPERERAWACRGVRGAVAVGDEDGALEGAVGELLLQLLRRNEASAEDVAAAIFTIPEDLRGLNPAAAARACGFEAVPLLAVREHGGDQRVGRCLRVLLLLNTPRRQEEVRHAYLGEAAVLRPDLVGVPEVGR